MKHTTADRDPQAAARLHELIADIGVAMVTTVTPDGALRSRPMFTRELIEERQLWFFTLDDSGMAHDIAAEHGVNVSYADPGRDRYVSVTGRATVLRDDAKMQELWEPELARFFPRGLDDPHLALLRVKVEWAEYWDAAGGRMLRVHETGQPSPADAGDAEPEAHARIDVRETRASG